MLLCHDYEPDPDSLEAVACELVAALDELREWHKGEYQGHPEIDARADKAIAHAKRIGLTFTQKEP